MAKETAQTTGLSNIADNAGARKGGIRVGRGIGSGKGKTCGRGHKGQKSRTGGSKVAPGFEGGQNPLYRRLPMRGFNNKNFTKTYAQVNVGQIQAMVDAGRINAKDTITIETIQAAGLTKKAYDGLKLLGNGEVSAKLNISAAAATKSALEKITKSGGKVDLPEAKEKVRKLAKKADRK